MSSQVNHVCRLFSISSFHASVLSHCPSSRLLSFLPFLCTRYSQLRYNHMSQSHDSISRFIYPLEYFILRLLAQIRSSSRTEPCAHSCSSIHSSHPHHSLPRFHVCLALHKLRMKAHLDYNPTFVFVGHVIDGVY